MIYITGKIREKGKKLRKYYHNHLLITLKVIFYIIFVCIVIFDIHLFLRPEFLSVLDVFDTIFFYVLFNIITVGYAIMVVITVYIDAKKIRAGEAFKCGEVTKAETWKPYVWALLVLFLCFPFFGFYLWYRRKIFHANVNGCSEKK